MPISSPLRATPPSFFYETARFNMIESQVRPNGVVDEGVIRAMSRLPREEFTAEDARSFAYSDEEVSAGFGRRLLTPMVLARLAQEARIREADRVLDVGAVTGYSAAVLNDLAGEVVALESDPALSRLLQQNQQRFELGHLRVVQGNLSDGYPAASPYQVIIIEGGVEWLPESLLGQLAEGGRLLCVVYSASPLPDQLGRARIYERRGGKIATRDLFDAAAPLLPAFAARPRFEF